MQHGTNIAQKEHDKYAAIWKAQNYRSGNAIPFAKQLQKEPNFGGIILEIGCGDGITAAKLIKRGHLVTATDITLAGISENIKGIKAPAWELPFPNNTFDTVYSTDVLEHLPPDMVQPTIQELKRVTTDDAWHYHTIATFPDQRYQGYEVHLTVHDIMWWHGQFIKHLRNFKLFAR